MDPDDKESDCVGHVGQTNQKFFGLKGLIFFFTCESSRRVSFGSYVSRNRQQLIGQKFQVYHERIGNKGMQMVKFAQGKDRGDRTEMQG